MAHPEPRRRPLVTLLGSGLVVVLTGWAGPVDGGALETDAGTAGATLWDDSASIAWVLAVAEQDPRRLVATRLVAQGPRVAPAPRPRRLRHWGPTRLGLALPPLVCLVDLQEPSDMLTPPPGGDALSPAPAATILRSRRPAGTLSDPLTLAQGQRYRLAPKGSPPA